MIFRFLYSKIRLFFSWNVKSKFGTFINKKTSLGTNIKLSIGDFSGSVIGSGTYTGSSLPLTKIGSIVLLEEIVI